MSMMRLGFASLVSRSSQKLGQFYLHHRREILPHALPDKGKAPFFLPHRISHTIFYTTAPRACIDVAIGSRVRVDRLRADREEFPVEVPSPFSKCYTASGADSCWRRPVYGVGISWAAAD